MSANPDLLFNTVVVGGGWANCAIAARLSERSNTRIARVEADGEKRHEQSYFPICAATLPGPASHLLTAGDNQLIRPAERT